jgi:hypothetical protein
MVPAHHVIPRVLAQIVRPAPLCQEKVEFAWRMAVGPAIGRVSSVRLDADGRIRVTVPDGRWRREVQRSIGLITNRLETLVGADTAAKVEIICHE